MTKLCDLHTHSVFSDGTYTPETTQLALDMASRFGLKYSGGSDFHGAAKPEIQLGRVLGDLQIPAKWLEALKR